jgi:putative FmdB family regulatory protein
MPLYEYFCPTCNDTFEKLRPVIQADLATVCPTCQKQSSQRVLSLVASSVLKGTSSGVQETAMPSSAGGGCCGGSCGCHH